MFEGESTKKGHKKSNVTMHMENIAPRRIRLSVGVGVGLRKYKVAKSWGLSKSQERGREMRMGIMGYNQGKSPTTPSRLPPLYLLPKDYC